eukprot:TRINITY_DN4065_c0_g1_i3.p2 TRINITY_DN4065_c0_g1~~TRINITY_DN4065_c0_g1_i3.p2  ORF type:complete len:106 (-),score=24.90 TRINITY_DN4065_c0_g1_i3:6-323(-)
MLLCVGDGFAGLFGELFGKTKLPYNPRKSIVGSLSFLIFSVIVTSVYVELFHEWGWFNVTASQFLPSLLASALIGTIVESLPGFGAFDNITVFAASLITLHAMGW